MVKVMKKIFVFTIVMCVSSLSFASKWSTVGSVNHVLSHDGYHIVITSINEGACDTLGKFYWPTSDADAKDMLSIALTALSTQMKVKFYYSEDVADCKFGNTSALATHMQISR